MRELGIPTVLDRFIQQALLQVLQSDLDGSFSRHSTASDLGAVHMKQFARRNASSSKDAAGWWTWIWKSSSTGSTTMC